MKKILFVDNNLHFNGGGERVLCHMANWYASKNYDITILSIGAKQSNSTFPLNRNVKIEYLNVNPTRVIGNIVTIFKLAKFLRRRQYDFILGIGTNVNVYLGCVAKLFTQNKYIGCEHNSFDCVPSMWQFLRKISYSMLDAVVILTKSDLDKVVRLNKSTFVIPNSILPNDSSSDLAARKFLAIGRLSYQKAFERMVDIYSDFHKIVPDWRLDIVGDGPDLSKLEKMIAERNLNDWIRIHSFTQDITKFYQDSSVYLMTSRFEGLPMVLLESQSYGMPIISYDCDTGPRDIISNGENGFLIEVDDKNSFVNAMVILAKDSNLRYKMGYNSKKNIEKFYPENIFVMWDNLFDKFRQEMI